MKAILENIKKYKYRILSTSVFSLIAVVVILYFFSQTLIRHNAKAALDGVDIKLIPADITVKKDGEFSVSVTVDTKEKIITATELHISYDEKVLQGTSIKAGTMLSVVLKDGEFRDGDASLIIGCAPTERKKGVGLIATLTFKTLISTNTRIDFAKNTKIAVLGEANNMVGNMTGVEIIPEELSPVTPMVSPTILPTTVPTEGISPIPPSEIEPTVNVSTPSLAPTGAHTTLPTLYPSKQPQIPEILTPTPSETVLTKIVHSILSFPSSFIQKHPPSQLHPTSVPKVADSIIQPSPVISSSDMEEKKSFVLDVQKQMIASSSDDDFTVPTAPQMTPVPPKKDPITGIPFVDNILHFFGF